MRAIRHSVEQLAACDQVIDQFDFRKQLVLDELAKENIPFEFDAIIGRGGLVKPIPGGVYEVNEAMRRDTRHAMRTHACNLGCLIAAAYVYAHCDKVYSSAPTLYWCAIYNRGSHSMVPFPIRQVPLA